MLVFGVSSLVRSVSEELCCRIRWNWLSSNIVAVWAWNGWVDMALTGWFKELLCVRPVIRTKHSWPQWLF